MKRKTNGGTSRKGACLPLHYHFQNPNLGYGTMRDWGSGASVRNASPSDRFLERGKTAWSLLMLPSEEQLLKMSLPEIEHLLNGCFRNSDQWNVVWPVYESKKRRAENRRTVIYFSISTTIALVALIRSFFPMPQNTGHSPVSNAPPLTKDPLSLFHANPPLENCLKAVNPSDPLGLRTNDAAQDRQRQDCIAQYANAR